MKKIFVAVFVLASIITQAQERLWGTWKASCPTLFESSSRIKHCELCPRYLDKMDNRLCVSDFDLIINQATITITKENVSHGMIPYTWDNEKHIISFEFQDKKFNLRAHYGLADIILINDDGTVVILRDKKTVIVPLEER